MRHRQYTSRASVLSLGLLFVALAPLGGCNLELSTDVEAKDQWTRTYPLSDGGTVVLSNTNGKINVTGGEGETVTVTADRIVKARTEEAAKQQLDLLEMKEDVTPDRVSIDSRVSGLTISVSRRVDYTVTMPSGASLTLVTTNGDILVSNIGGHFSAEASNGRITATGLHQSAKVSNTNGLVSLTLDDVSGEGVSAETTNGAIVVSLPKAVNAELSARVVNGKIMNDGLDLQVSEESRRRLDGRLGAGGPMIRLETTNGAVTVKGRN